MYVPGRAFKPSLMFAAKAGANLSEAPFMGSTLGLAPGLNRKRALKMADSRAKKLRQTCFQDRRRSFRCLSTFFDVP